jgi:hypothetical protein
MRRPLTRKQNLNRAWDPDLLCTSLAISRGPFSMDNNNMEEKPEVACSLSQPSESFPSGLK